MKKINSISILILFIISCSMKLTTEEVLERYDDGNMKVVGYYKKVGENKILVKHTEYYKSGQIEEISTFKNGLLEGSHTEYYKSGQIEEEGTFKNGLLEGKYIQYNKDGSIENEEIIKMKIIK